MNNEVRYVGNKKVAENKASTNIKSGFVKDVITFMVLDDLVIQPMSTISSITLLNKFNVKEIGTLQEKVVEMGMDEVSVYTMCKQT
jgi:hydroxymethylpyrimidine/phosphomethylpyrimidine kinase